MRIDAVKIQNFRGITDITLENLSDLVVIAGANGSGKSCIFDAIRLLKSVYGGYQQNEWHHWMSEFQINFANDAQSFAELTQDKSKRLVIRCEFRLHPEERAFLQQHGEDLVRRSIWRLIAPEMFGWSSYRAAPMAAQYREREAEVQERTTEQLRILKDELSNELVVGEMFLNPNDQPLIETSKALEIIFATFEPRKLGVIDYHGAHRAYGREQVSGINLNLDAQEQQRSQHALYNYASKYSNVKSEMAAAFIKELLIEKTGGDVTRARDALASTLSELFAHFFPEKQFLGPTPTSSGALSFPVRTASGARHDLNELSSGEKEVLFGYLRIRNSAPRYSVILIDEPELHLNPRLIRGLPQFYFKHLGKALDNQIWLITHSDALLREVVGRKEYSVFHMRPASGDESQIAPLAVAQDLEQAIINLVGDLAAYRPGDKLVIFEGGGDSEFDRQMTCDLFPELPSKANTISGGYKARVRDLHSVLEETASKGIVAFKVYSIVDRDGDSSAVAAPRFVWDRYHIENYLLEAEFVHRALADLRIASLPRQDLVYDALRGAAASTLDSLVRHELRSASNDRLVRTLNLAGDPKRTDVAAMLRESIERSISRLNELANNDLTLQKLANDEAELRQRFKQDLATDAWRQSFRGRDVLKRFVTDHVPVMGYEPFRNLILARMRDANFRPPGMQAVVEQILGANERAAPGTPGL